MKTAGEILKSERIKKGLSLEEIAKQTKIKLEFLKAIEDQDYQKLPSSAYAKGFVRNYAQTLGLDVTKLMAFFRREYEEGKAKVKLPPQPIDAPAIALTPGKIITFFVSAAIIIFLAVLFWQYKSFAGAPVLLVSSPLDKVAIDRPFVGVVGRTDEDAQVFVNGQEVRVSSEGIFEETINLSPGLNTIRILARNKVGKESIVERVVEVKE
ncbi:MAG: helix-turn-helix domain-containing protein [Candidatus Cloacimonetes bacterium]|nr:helix-turn-helix domain-containing protein [Candidatus Cloacimonadota bacterium]